MKKSKIAPAPSNGVGTSGTTSPSLDLKKSKIAPISPDCSLGGGGGLSDGIVELNLSNGMIASGPASPSTAKVASLTIPPFANNGIWGI